MTNGQKKRNALLACLLAAALLLCGCSVAASGKIAAPLATEAMPTGTEPEPTALALPAEVFPVNAPTGAENETVVSTVDEFLAAIGSDRVIYLQAGVYDLTQAENYGNASGSSSYDWAEAGDGFRLQIHGVQNLSIIGYSATDVTICTVPRSAEVLDFDGCSGISISSMTAGHTEGAGFCTGAVLRFASSETVSVADCDLYGCGTLGLEIWDCKDVSARNCTIRECSLGGIQVFDSRNVVLQDSRIVNCGSAEDPAISVLWMARSDAVAVVDCTVQGNAAGSLLSSEYCQNVALLGSRVQGNVFAGSAFALVQYGPVVEGCAFTENTIPAWYADAEGSGALAQAVSKAGKPLGDQELTDMQQFDVAYEAPTPAPASADDPTPTPAQAADGAMREVQAATVDELLAAIASDTTVYLADGTYDLSRAANYGALGTDGYRWEENFDGPGLVVIGVTNFHIAGGGADKVTICAIPRYANVLAYENCENVSVAGVTLGHTEAPGECSGGVVQFMNTRTAAIRDCGLFGCGILGVQAFESSGIAIDGTEIYDCSVGAASFYGCTDVALTNCSIHDCGEPTFSVSRSKNVTNDGAALPSSDG